MVLHGFQGRGSKKRRLAAGRRRTSDCPEFAPRVGVIVQIETNAPSIPGHRYVPRPREESQTLTAQMRGDAATCRTSRVSSCPRTEIKVRGGGIPALSRRPLPRGFRPFVGPILKHNKGSNGSGRRLLAERPVMVVPSLCLNGRQSTLAVGVTGSTHRSNSDPNAAPPTPAGHFRSALPDDRKSNFQRTIRRHYGPKKRANRLSNFREGLIPNSARS